jgi:peroxiredoxin
VTRERSVETSTGTGGRGPRTRRRAGAAVVLAAVLVVAAGAAVMYLGRGPDEIEPGPAEEAAATPTSRVAVGGQTGQRAPDFALTTTTGEPFRLSSYRGRVVLLDFLAPGCPSCAAEVPSLTKAWMAFRDRGVAVVLIDVSGGRVDVPYYRSVGGGDFLYAADVGFRVAKRYEVLALGTSVIVGPDGIVTYVDSGPTTAEVFDRELGKALS